MNTVRTTFIKRLTGLTMVTCLSIASDAKAIDRFGKYPCTGGLPNAARSTEKICMTQLIVRDGICKGCGGRLLSYDIIKVIRSVFSCRNNEVFHYASQN